MVLRLDFGRLSKAKPLAAGGRLVPAFLTRVGVFTYRRADGSEVRELRLPEEVFHADSLASLKAAPVTDLHPTEEVNPTNWRKYAVGTVGSEPKQDGQYVSAELAINDQDAIKRVDAGQRSELSCGYTCDVEVKSGEFGGERYDAIQRNIRYNHVAMGPRNWGRAGNAVSMRLDSSDAICITGNPEKETKTMKTVRIDGIDYPVDSDAFDQALSKFQQRADAALAENETLKAERDAATAKLDEKRRNDAKLDEQRIDAAVALRFDAQSVLGADYDFKGRSQRDIMIDAVLKTDSSFDAEGKSDDYLRARFDMTVEEVAKRTDAHQRSRDSHSRIRSDAQRSKPDADDPIAKARADARERNAKAWQAPLAMSKA